MEWRDEGKVGGSREKAGEGEDKEEEEKTSQDEEERSSALIPPMLEVKKLQDINNYYSVYCRKMSLRLPESGSQKQKNAEQHTSAPNVFSGDWRIEPVFKQNIVNNQLSKL